MADFDLYIKKKEKRLLFLSWKFLKLFPEIVNVRKKCSMKLFALFNYQGA